MMFTQEQNESRMNEKNLPIYYAAVGNRCFMSEMIRAEN